MTNPRRALITGAAGFIGGRLAAQLVQQGWEVHALVRRSSNTDDLAGLGISLHVDDGVSALHDVVGAAGPDVCFHLAGYFVGSHRDGDIARLVADNVLFGTRLADALASRGGCTLVNAGTYWQHADGAPYRPVALYAATKQAFQDVLRYYVERTNLAVVTLKFFETYGPGDSRPKLLNLLLDAAASGRSIGVSPGQQLVDLVHVEDAVAACLAAAAPSLAARGSGYHSFAVTSGAPLQLRQLVEQVGEAIGRPVPVEWGAREYRWREMMQPWDAGAPVPGWAPAIPLEVGIAEMWRIMIAPPAAGDGQASPWPSGSSSASSRLLAST
ncbi:MAG: NAD-dependent dehydratase [Acidimicrobiaceae bacterium]|nr:NAD-dependent dehydratase [Acidimicrobiaceae bacterium]